MSAPKPSQPLQAGSASYNAALNSGAQSTTMEVARTIVEEGDTWVVTESAKLPQGEVTDKTVLDKGSLAVRSRAIDRAIPLSAAGWASLERWPAMRAADDHSLPGSPAAMRFPAHRTTPSVPRA